jgi:hypothetical protein
VKKFRLLLVGLATCVLMPLAAAEPVFADTAPPAPLSSIIPAPLSRFGIEINGVTQGNGPVMSAFLAWYATHPADVVAFLQFLQDNPAVARSFYDWVQANPVQAAALYNALALDLLLPAVQKVR